MEILKFYLIGSEKFIIIMNKAPGLKIIILIFIISIISIISYYIFNHDD